MSDTNETDFTAARAEAKLDDVILGQKAIVAAINKLASVIDTNNELLAVLVAGLHGEEALPKG